jgi:hypothetical protein
VGDALVGVLSALPWPGVDVEDDGVGVVVRFVEMGHVVVLELVEG